MTAIFTFLLPYMRGNFFGQRVVTAALVAEFVNFCKNDAKLLSQLVNCLLGSLADPIVKLYVLRGLGNIASVGDEQGNKYAPTVLDALLSSIDDQNEAIAMEAMNGLAKVFAMVEDSRIAPILMNICHRIKPAFDKENEEIRAASYRLFGALSRFGEGNATDAFFDIIHSNLPTLILHANDENESVSTACRKAILQLAPLYKLEAVVKILSSPNLDEGKSLDYPEFLNDLSIALIDSYPDKMNYYVMTSIEYFKSNWNKIRASACCFVGFLLGNLPVEKRKLTTLNPGLVSKALILMLKEKDPKVRKICSQAMSLLYTY